MFPRAQQIAPDLAALLLTHTASVAQPLLLDRTDSLGLGADILGPGIARCALIDLNNDHFPDVVIDRTRIFLNTPDDSAPLGRRFLEVADTGLPPLHTGDLAVYADLDNDGNRDALITRYIDLHNEKWNDHGLRTAWHRGLGDGTFDPEPNPIAAATPATTCAVAIADFDADGRLDLAFGNWYTHYGVSLEAYSTDILLQRTDAEGLIIFERLPLAQDLASFDEENDAAGRPTYGLLAAFLPELSAPLHLPCLFEGNYGRRWNRLLVPVPDDSAPLGWRYENRAAALGLDGDDIRHGRHPDWLAERAKTDPRFDRPDEKPFRANGNTFDASLGDFDNDADFDLLITEITHGWAGDSSDRSRLLLYHRGTQRFEPDASLSLDRIPPDAQNWNHGDLFGHLGDFNNDSRLDILLSSGDYPDNQRLRLFLQQPDGSLRDATADIALDHDGSQQIAVGDLDNDGSLDLLVGQTFFRYTAEMKEGRTPALKAFMGDPAAQGTSLTLRLQGDPDKGVSRDALGAMVRLRLDDGSLRIAQLTGVGGHAGKQNDFLLHFGLGDRERIAMLEVMWPDRARTREVFEDVAPGAWSLTQGRTLTPLPGDDRP